MTPTRSPSRTVSCASRSRTARCWGRPSALPGHHYEIGPPVHPSYRGVYERLWPRGGSSSGSPGLPSCAARGIPAVVSAGFDDLRILRGFGERDVQRLLRTRPSSGTAERSERRCGTALSTLLGLLDLVTPLHRLFLEQPSFASSAPRARHATGRRRPRSRRAVQGASPCGASGSSARRRAYCRGFMPAGS